VITSEKAARFVELKNLLVEWTDDDPANVFDLARSDETFRNKATSLSSLANELLESHRHAEGGIIAPVSQSFIDAWRDYERFRSVVGPIELVEQIRKTIDAFRAEEGNEVRATWEDGYRRAAIMYPTGSRWDIADKRAASAAPDIEELLDKGASLVMRALTLEDESYEDLVDQDLFDIAYAAPQEWSYLTKDLSFDVRGYIRRSRLAPLLLVPHVINNEVPGELVNLYDLWKDVRNSYISGSFLATIALSRAIVEKILVRFYKLRGDGLPDLIRKGERYFTERSLAHELHDIRKLANTILHGGQEDTTHDISISISSKRGIFASPTDQEMRLLDSLEAVRSLIERLPKEISRSSS
jgi:hypothetical protein